MSEWDAWIGNEERRDERVCADRALRWLAALERGPLDTLDMPQGFHWCLVTPDCDPNLLGPDGHPDRAHRRSFLPPIPQPRRMWTASTISFHRPIRVGEIVERVSRIEAIRDKVGSTGPMVFVDVAHETRCGGALAVHEVQTLVFRNSPPADAPASPPPLGEAVFDPAGWDRHRAMAPDEVLLFRYSAMTFNSHRIHYDHPYATAVEGYRGLVVHGPLTATLLLDLARREGRDNALRTFTFRGVSPAICGEMLHLVLRSKGAAFELGAFAADGREVMRATASV